jgi:hypothetical protein
MQSADAIAGVDLQNRRSENADAGTRAQTSELTLESPG